VVFLEAADPRGLGEFGRRLEDPFFLQDRFDVGAMFDACGRLGGCGGGRESGHGKIR
jgi:hypothetical protein